MHLKMPVVDEKNMDERTRELLAFFAGRLVEYRGKSKLSQASVAERAGISLRQYQYLEGGKSAPNIDTLCRISIALNVGPCSLMPNKSWTVRTYRVDETAQRG